VVYCELSHKEDKKVRVKTGKFSLHSKTYPVKNKLSGYSPSWLSTASDHE
jgi:hypothetical protein